MGKVPMLHLCPPHHSVLWKIAQGPCWDYAQPSIEGYFLWGQTLTCSTIIPSTARVPLSRGNNAIFLNERDGKCMTRGCAYSLSEREQHTGEIDFMSRNIQKRQYGYSEISAVLGPERNGALLLGSSANPRRPITFKNSQPLFFHKEQSPGGNSDLKCIKFPFFKVLLFSWRRDKLCLEGQICKWIHMEKSLCVGNIIQVNGTLWGHRSLPGPSCNLKSVLCSFKVKACYKPQQYFFLIKKLLCLCFY